MSSKAKSSCGLTLASVAALVFGAGCGEEPATPEASADVHAFLALLVGPDDPTLAQLDAYVGTANEAELEFEIDECMRRGWEPSGRECIDFTRARWASPESNSSYYLSWLRTRFSTIGKDYQILKIEEKSDGITYQLITVSVGEREFMLVHNLDPERPTGVLVDVSQVDGMDLESFKED